MLALRYAAVLALACWGGGLLAIGAVAAPAAFEVLGTGGAQGRALAGALVAEALGRFTWVAYLCGAVVLASLAVRAVLGPRPRRFSLRLSGIILMLSAAAYAGVALFPRIVAASAATGSVPSTLGEHDPRRLEFARLHRLSMLVQLVPLVGGAALLFWELKD